MISHTNGLVSPMPLQSVAVKCIHCGYMGSEKLVYSLFGKLKNLICPSCEKKGLVRNPMVRY